MKENSTRIDQRAIRSRSKLSRALVDLLKEKDIEEITVREISKKAGISSLTFYNHFHNKFDLMDYCFYLNIEPILDSIPSLIRGTMDEKEALKRIVSAFVHYVYLKYDVLQGFVKNDTNKSVYWALTNLVVKIFDKVREIDRLIIPMGDMPEKLVDVFYAGGLTYLFYELMKAGPVYGEKKAIDFFTSLIDKR